MKKLIPYLVLFPLLLFILCFSAAAEEEEVPLDFKKCDTEFHSARYIKCLSENSRGDIAMVLAEGKINIYDCEGNFQHSYSYARGTASAGFTEDDEIWVEVSWTKIYVYNENGDFLRTIDLSDMSNLERDELYGKPGRNQTVVGENGTFQASDWFFWSKLTLTRPDGTEEIVYEAGWDQRWPVLLIPFACMCFFAVGILALLPTVSARWDKTVGNSSQPSRG